MFFPRTLEGLDRAAEENLRGDELLHYKRVRQMLLNQELTLDLLLEQLDDFIRRNMKFTDGLIVRELRRSL